MTIPGNGRSGSALALVLSLVGATACGVVYEPQKFTESSLSYGYKGDFSGEINLVTLDFATVRTANGDGYVPRALPDVFAELDPLPDISVRDRIAAAGLDRVEPPLIFEPPVAYAPYDGTREVLQPGLRNDGFSPLPTLALSRNALDTRPGAAAGALPTVGTDPMVPLDPLTLRRELRSNPLPATTPPPYTVGSGDVITLLSRERSLPSLRVNGDAGSVGTTGKQDLLVRDNGEIFIPEVGAVRVGGLTLSAALSRISQRLVEEQVGFDVGVEITEFGSKRIAVNGLSENLLLPVTVSPTTLGEAVTLSGGVGSNPENVIVRVLRDGVIYEMGGEDVAGSSELSSRTLLADDILSITPVYDVELALTYFDQQLRLRTVERDRLSNEITLRAEGRAVEDFERSRLRMQIELENYALEAERLRQEAEIARLAASRDTDRLNEEARLANIRTRQAYLDQLRALEQTNREALRGFRNETREVLLSNQSQKIRERGDLRALLELELREERLRLEQRAAQRQQGRALFSERVRLGAIRQDYVVITGETRRQTTMSMPFDQQLTLDRVLYEETSGIDPITGNTSEIYVFRLTGGFNPAERVTAFHLDASNPAALTVASLFEMRPKDIVYVNPQRITSWNRVLSQLLPSTGLLQSGVSAAGGL